MKNLTSEMIEKAKAAKNTDELLEIAKENNVEMTADEAATYFAQLNPKSGELSDDDLDSVAGGACSANSDTLAIGTKVRVTSGQICNQCGGNVGVVESWAFGYRFSGKGVACTNCSTDNTKHMVVNYIEDCTYEVIG